MPETVLTLRREDWPLSQSGLVFVWRNALERDPVPCGGAEARLLWHGLAFPNQDGAMQFRGGWGDASGDAARISDACRESGAFTIEAVLKPQPASKMEPDGTILALGNESGGDDLILQQKGWHVDLALRTARAPAGGLPLLEDIANLSDDEAVHLLIGFAKGRLSIFVNGEERIWKPEFPGDLSNWRAASFCLGAMSDGSHPWRGLIERVAVYDRLLSSEEAAAHAQSWKTVHQARKVPLEWMVQAKLIESTPAPGLKEIQPYTEALVRQLFELRGEVHGDGALPGQIVVTQWAWLGGRPMSAQSIKLGDVVSLNLHQMEAHPELKPLLIKDGLTRGFDASVFYDVTDWDDPQRRNSR